MAEPSIKDEELYEKLRSEGASKEKAARIANAAAARGRSEVSAAGGSKPPYEEWTKDELLDRARRLDIEGRSSMNKQELIDALRSR